MSSIHSSANLTTSVSENFLTGSVRDNLSRYVRHRYADFWRNTVQMDWFKVIVYPSSDTDKIRELDFALDEPELASLVGKLAEVEVFPQDLLVGIGAAMTATPGANDPDLWAAIDVGRLVCRQHYEDDPFWEARVSLLAGTAITAFATNESLKGAVYMHHPEKADERRIVPKIHRLVDYLIWTAAGERYLGPGQMLPEKSQEFRLENDLFVSLITRAADAALAMSSIKTLHGPLTTAEIAERGHLLISEVLQSLLPSPIPLLSAERVRRLAPIHDRGGE